MIKLLALATLLIARFAIAAPAHEDTRPSPCAAEEKRESREEAPALQSFDGTDAERRGCCSHHGGVCGCSGGSSRCCDGSISPTCDC